MAEKFLEPQNPLKKIDEITGDVTYVYPLTTDKQVVMENGERLNTILNGRIVYYDADGNFYKDKDMTILFIPRTKVRAISDDNGVGLDVILNECATKNYVTEQIELSIGSAIGGSY